MNVISEKPFHPIRPWRESLARGCGLWGARALRMLPPERARRLGLWLLDHDLMRHLGEPVLQEQSTGLAVAIRGLGSLQHPIGLAAGWDPSGRHLSGLSSLGISFVELGTVTPLPAHEDHRDGLQLLPAQRAVTFRPGAVSAGAHELSGRLQESRRLGYPLPMGVNCAANPGTPFELIAEDLLASLEALQDVAEYFVFNVPLAQLREEELNYLIPQLGERLEPYLPKLWLKLGPGLGKRLFQDVVRAADRYGFGGLIVGDAHRALQADITGISGHPVAAASTALLEWAFDASEGRLPMIASGGVLSGTDVFEKIARGASAVQIYSALIYRGPYVVLELLEELVAELHARGYSCITDAVGTYFRP